MFTAVSVVLEPSFSPTANAQVPNGYAIRDSVALVASVNGVDGQLQLLEDERLTPTIRSVLWGSTLWAFCDDREDEAVQSFCDSASVAPLRVAVLQVVDEGGNVLDQFRANRWLGDLSARALVPDAPVTYLITIDYSAGFGSYSGPITSFVDVRDGSFQWLMAQQVNGAGRNEIRVMESVKTAWRIVPARRGPGADILEVACRPDPAATKSGEDLRFLTTFRRYFYQDGRWWLAERTEPGLWENEGTFPDASEFP